MECGITASSGKGIVNDPLRPSVGSNASLSAPHTVVGSRWSPDLNLGKLVNSEVSLYNRGLRLKQEFGTGRKRVAGVRFIMVWFLSKLSRPYNTQTT